MLIGGLVVAFLLVLSGLLVRVCFVGLLNVAFLGIWLLGFYCWWFVACVAFICWGLCLHVILKFVGLFGLFTLLVNAAFLGRFGVLIVWLDLLLVLGLIAV